MIPLKNKILFINFNQFGYDTAYFYYVKYLTLNKFEVDYWCLQKNFPKIEYLGNNIVYYSSPNSLYALFALIIKLGLKLRGSKYDYIIYRNAKFAFLIRLISSKKGIYDLRTLTISSSSFKRFLGSCYHKMNIIFFHKIFTISSQLANELKVDKDKCYIIPLGSDHSFLREINKIENLNLIYLGTLNKRNIDETVKGAVLFAIGNPKLKIKYRIVGNGSKEEIDKIENAIKKAPSNLEVLRYEFIPNNLLSELLFDSSIGISYVPITKWYYLQPPTKTIEYLVAGLAVIATKLPANLEIVTENNGVLIDDNPASFSIGLNNLYSNINKYDMNSIAKNAEYLLWKNIVRNKLIPALIK